MEIALSVAGLIVVVVITATAIRLLRQPKHRYLGDPERQERRSFRETMVTRLGGSRSGEL